MEGKYRKYVETLLENEDEDGYDSVKPSLIKSLKNWVKDPSSNKLHGIKCSRISLGNTTDNKEINTKSKLRDFDISKIKKELKKKGTSLENIVNSNDQESIKNIFYNDADFKNNLLGNSLSNKAQEINDKGIKTAEEDSEKKDIYKGHDPNVPEKIGDAILHIIPEYQKIFKSNKEEYIKNLNGRNSKELYNALLLLNYFISSAAIHPNIKEKKDIEIEAIKNDKEQYESLKHNQDVGNFNYQKDILGEYVKTLGASEDSIIGCLSKNVSSSKKNIFSDTAEPKMLWRMNTETKLNFDKKEITELLDKINNNEINNNEIKEKIQKIKNALPDKKRLGGKLKNSSDVDKLDSLDDVKEFLNMVKDLTLNSSRVTIKKNIGPMLEFLGAKVVNGNANFDGKVIDPSNDSNEYGTERGNWKKSVVLYTGANRETFIEKVGAVWAIPGKQKIKSLDSVLNVFEHIRNINGEKSIESRNYTFSKKFSGGNNHDYLKYPVYGEDELVGADKILQEADNNIFGVVDGKKWINNNKLELLNPSSLSFKYYGYGRFNSNKDGQEVPYGTIPIGNYTYSLPKLMYDSVFTIFVHDVSNRINLFANYILDESFNLSGFVKSIYDQVQGKKQINDEEASLLKDEFNKKMDELKTLLEENNLPNILPNNSPSKLDNLNMLKAIFLFSCIVMTVSSIQKTNLNNLKSVLVEFNKNNINDADDGKQNLNEDNNNLKAFMSKAMQEINSIKKCTIKNAKKPISKKDVINEIDNVQNNLAKMSTSYKKVASSILHIKNSIGIGSNNKQYITSFDDIKNLDRKTLKEEANNIRNRK